MVDIFFETHNNKPVYIHLDFCSQISSRFCSVKTDKGELKWDLIKNNVTWTDLNSTINTWNFQEDRDGMYINQLNHFFDCTESDGKPKVTIEDGISIQKLIDSIQAGNIRSSI